MAPLLLSTLLLCPLFTEGFRVLIVGAHFPSHYLERHAIGDVLIEQGHDVFTVVQDSFQESYIADLKDRGFQVILQHLAPNEEPITGKSFQSVVRNIIFDNDMSSMAVLGDIVTNKGARDCASLLEPAFLARLEDLRVDVALVDGFHFAPCYGLIAHALRVPWVSWFSQYIPSLLALPVLPSFVPTIGIGAYKPYTFVERVQNTADLLHALVTHGALGFDSSSNLHLLRREAPGVDSWQALRRQACLSMQTRDHHLDSIVPSMPHFVQLPGVTYRPARLLPHDLATLVSAAGEHGVIVFTMGSGIGELPRRVLSAMMDAFSRLRQTVLMRYTGDVGDVTVPSNVHMRSWLPQNDLLGQNNTRLFINHAGNNGQYEAAYHGVPQLALPVYVDQPANAARVTARGLARSLSLHTLTADELESTIRTMLETPSYSRRATWLSAVLKDRPRLPAADAAYWVIHVAKHGCQHLRSAALGMPWYTLYLLDVLLAALAAVLLTLAITGAFIRILTRRGLHDGGQTAKTKQQ